jgi:AcrR family transcriptional regulator
MPTERRSRRAGGSRRTAVLEAAATVLAERGYETTRFADVSEASGVAISTLQNYFGSREDMLIEAMRHATDAEVRALEMVAGSEADPWNRLVAMIDRNLNSPVHKHRLLFEFWRSGMRDAELRDYAQEGWIRYRSPFLATVTKGKDAGVFRPTTNPDDVVDLLLASLGGAMVPRVLDFPAPSSGHFRTALLRQTALMLGRAD